MSRQNDPSLAPVPLLTASSLWNLSMSLIIAPHEVPCTSALPGTISTTSNLGSSTLASTLRRYAPLFPAKLPRFPSSARCVAPTENLCLTPFRGSRYRSDMSWMLSMSSSSASCPFSSSLLLPPPLLPWAL